MVKMELGLTATQIRLDTISHVRRPTDPPIRSTMCSQIRTRSVQLLSVVAEVRFVHVTLDLMCSDVRFVLIPNRRLNGLKCKRSNCFKIAELNCNGSICSEGISYCVTTELTNVTFAHLVMFNPETIVASWVGHKII
uniref:Uncharacterized protein n=1 Tax=Kalanchoe fedtschenkoi TaxID=63787 RepID=A0A7N0THA3_KALFE